MQRLKVKNAGNVLLLLTLLILAVRCPSKDNHTPMSKIIPIKGDPMVFLKNTTTDENSGIPLSLITTDSEWELQASGYVASEQQEIKSQDDAEEKNKPTEINETENLKENLVYYKLSKKSGSTETFTFISPRESTFNLHMKKDGETLKLSTIGFPNTVINNFKVHHYSVKTDNSSFSILTSFKVLGYSYLYSFNFIKKKSSSILESTLDKVYQYLNGPGVVSKWNQDQTLKVHICKHSIPTYNRLMKESIDRWMPHLTHRLRIEAVVSDACPPFSDLNTLTIMHVSDWVEVLGPWGNLAQTMTLHNYYESEIIDSDIFFLESEWNQGYEDSGLALSDSSLYESSRFQRRYKRTMTHEMGHSLGLDHKFDGTVSIMDYSDTSEIKDYDIKAIQSLYPEMKDEGLTEE